MKIALIAPVEESVPPKKYGGTEWIIYHLAHGLGKRGYDIDLFACGDSLQEKYYSLIPLAEKSLRTDRRFAQNLKMREAAKFLALGKTLDYLLGRNHYDLVHNHAGWRFLVFSHLLRSKNQRIVTTHHGPLHVDYANYIYLIFKDLYYVSISNNQCRDLPQLNYAATVYNGIDTLQFPFKESIGEKNGRGGYMLLLARLSPEKGAIEAAKTALNVKKPLIVAAKVDEVDKPYYEKFKNYIDHQYVSFIGEVDHTKRVDLYQNARLVLSPTSWEEPFGLMFTESMACGTPVVAFARGSVPEIVVDGETGLIVNQSEEDKRGEWIVKKTGIEGLCEAVERIYNMPQEEYRQMRRNCRARVEKHFTVERMVDNYEKVYRQILASS